MPFKRAGVAIPNKINVISHRSIMVKEFVNIFSFNFGKKGVIFPSKSEVMVRINSSVPREF